MKLLNISLLSALIAITTPAFSGDAGCHNGCEKSMYVFGYGGTTFDFDFEAYDGTTFLNSDYDSSSIVGGGFGIYSDFLCGSRFEIEGFSTEADLQNFGPGVPFTNGRFTNAAVFVNFLKEIPLRKCITGYVGAGVGLNESKLEFNGVADNNTELARQGIVGLEYNYCSALSFFGQYKIVGIPSSEYQLGAVNLTAESVVNQALVFGARFSF